MSSGASNKRILIKGGTVVNADHSFEADVFVENGKISEVGIFK